MQQGEKEMTFRTKTEESVQELNEESQSRQTTVESIDIEGLPFVKFGTDVFITGEFPEDEGNPVVRFVAQDYNDGRLDQGYLGLVLDNPGFLVDEDEGTENTVVVDTADEDSTEYRVFNPDSEQTIEKDYGIKFSGDVYDGDKIEPSEFDEDRIVLVVQGGASTAVAKALDKRGITARQVWDDEYNNATTNRGLVEYNPDPNSNEPRVRYARSPNRENGKSDLRNTVELRSELEGSEIGLLSTWRSNVDEDFAEELEEARENDDSEVRDSKWFSVFNMETEEKLEPGDYEEPVGSNYLTWTWDDNFSREDDPTIDENPLTEVEREFVEAYRESGQDTDEETVRQYVEEDLGDEANTEVIVETLAQ